MKVSKLQPREVFSQFERVASIPRGSGNTKEIASFFLDQAKAHGYDTFQDEIGNVMIFLPATEGYEDHETVILQAHLDMVCDQDSDCSLDMVKEGLELETDGKYLWADGTTLGGDDGIALAYLLAIMEADNIPHPPLEYLLTVDEEVGMVGARNLDPSKLKGSRMINMDSEEEGVLNVSCAGGVRANITYPLPLDRPIQKPDMVYELHIYGLKGGHSGRDINKQRINALKLLAKVVLEIEKKVPCSLVKFSGGLKDNAIPNEASALLSFEDKDDFLKICEELEEHIADLKKRITEDIGGLRVQFFPVEDMKYSCSREDTIKLMEFIRELPNGVWKMSKTNPDMVETSLNLAVAEMKDQSLRLNYFIRSNVNGEKEYIKKHVETCVDKYGASIEYYADYSAWEYKEDSSLQDIMVRAYQECFGKEPVLSSIHGGLECGILSASKLKDIDCISFGPDMYEVHTPKEHLDVESAKRCWTYLLKALELL